MLPCSNSSIICWFHLECSVETIGDGSSIDQSPINNMFGWNIIIQFTIICKPFWHWFNQFFNTIKPLTIIRNYWSTIHQSTTEKMINKFCPGFVHEPIDNGTVDPWPLGYPMLNTCSLFFWNSNWTWPISVIDLPIVNDQSICSMTNRQQN